MKLTVYHGSNIAVPEPSLKYGREDADFGLGFYVTPDFEMAEKWACRKNTPVVSKYTLEISKLSIFDFSVDKKWLDFVIANRNGENMPNFIDVNSYDIISGATADDKMFATIEQYEIGYISDDIAIKALNCMEIGDQMCIRTKNGLKNLHFEQALTIPQERASAVKEQNRSERKRANELTAKIIRDGIASEESDTPEDEEDISYFQSIIAKVDARQKQTKPRPKRNEKIRSDEWER